jgi:hypothetical protein
MLRPVVATLVAIISLAFAPPLQAQSSWYVVMSAFTNCGPPGSTCPRVTQLYRASVTGGQVSLDWVRDVPQSRTLEAYVTPDGGMVAWLGITALGPFVYLHDVASGNTSTIGPFHGAEGLVGNPTRPELYLFDGSGMTTLSPSLVRHTALDCHPDSINAPAFGVSRDGARVSESCFRGGEWGTLVVDTASGAPLRYVPRPGTISADGADILVGGFQPTSVAQRISVATGDILAEVVAAGNRLVVDPVSGDFLTTWVPWPGVIVRDGQTLVEKYSLLLDGRYALFSPAAPLLATSDSFSLALSNTGPAPGLVFRTGIPPISGTSMAFGPPPPAAPLNLSSRVTGNAAALSWAAGGPVASITSYVLEVGSAPGLSDIFTGLDVGLQTSFAASGVPPGTYYVRVRAGNYSGLSAPSNEVAVVVPWISRVAASGACS